MDLLMYVALQTIIMIAFINKNLDRFELDNNLGAKIKTLGQNHVSLKTYYFYFPKPYLF